MECDPYAGTTLVKKIVTIAWLVEVLLVHHLRPIPKAQNSKCLTFFSPNMVLVQYYV